MGYFRDNGPALGSETNLRPSVGAVVRASDCPLPIATGIVYLTTMAASELSPRSAVESHYHSLRADFDAAYRKMTDLSREFNAVLMTPPSELSPQERQARKGRAAQAYEAAHEEFLAAVARLHRFMIDRIIASHDALQPAERQLVSSIKQMDSRPR